VRRGRKVLLAVAIVLILLVGGLHFFLKNKLNSAIRTFVVPKAEQSLGVSVAVGDASINLFGGGLRVGQVNVGNPPGFAEPSLLSLDRLYVDLALLDLLKGTIRLSDAELDGTHLVIVRNKDGRVNTQEVQKRVAAIPSAATNGEETATGPAAAPPAVPLPAEPKKVMIDRIAIDLLLEYIDHGLSDKPVRIPLRLSVQGGNLSTTAKSSADWGTLSIRGHLDGDPKAYVTELSGRLAPLEDPKKASFDLAGNIAAIDLRESGLLKADSEFQGDTAAIEARLVCRDGAFDPKQSSLRIVVKNPKLSGKLAKKARGIPIPPELSVSGPVAGTLDKPEFDFQAALIRTVLENLSGSLGTLLESATKKEPKVKSEVDKAVKALGGLLK
jgi:uncharacterized protein involved in outer membrane biogenesis